ncbi:MAG TPA: porin family protein [Chitinophagaceae bacterium]|nr:porin family protein [Chitinophagaceae bacterium]
MKKVLFIAIAGFLSSGVFAQSFGVRAGVNIANVNIKTQGLSIKPGAVAGINAGIFLNFHLAPQVSLQPELAYSGMGYKVNVSGITGTETTSYLTLPVLLKVKIPASGLGIYAGPQAGILLSAKDKSQGETQDAGNNYKSTDFAGVAGLEYSFKLGLFFSARYQFSLANVASTNQGQSASVKNNCVSLLAGLRF